jgi:hypothetical protein
MFWHVGNPVTPSTPPLFKAAMAEADPTPKDSNEACYALLGLIYAKEPGAEDDTTWSRILTSFSVASPDQRHINLAVEAAGYQLLAELTDTLCRLLILKYNHAGDLVKGTYQDYTAAIAALPQRMLALGEARGVEFYEIVRQMVRERWAARDAVPLWPVVLARREAELE